MIRFSSMAAPTAVLVAAATLSCAKHRSIEPRPLADFKINVTATEAGIELACANACAWTTLTFSAIPWHRPVPIDRQGMTSTSGQTNPNRADFLFTVQRTERELRFQGLRGMAWTELTIGCNASGCTHSIDQHGMAAQ